MCPSTAETVRHELLDLDAYPDYGPMGMQVAGTREVFAPLDLCLLRVGRRRKNPL